MSVAPPAARRGARRARGASWCSRRRDPSGVRPAGSAPPSRRRCRARCSAPGSQALPAADRRRALEALGIPGPVATRATGVRVADALGARFVVFGSWDLGGGELTLTLAPFDVAAAEQRPSLVARGPLEDLGRLSTSWRASSPAGRRAPGGQEPASAPFAAAARPRRGPRRPRSPTRARGPAPRARPLPRLSRRRPRARAPALRRGPLRRGARRARRRRSRSRRFARERAVSRRARACSASAATPRRTSSTPRSPACEPDAGRARQSRDRAAAPAGRRRGRVDAAAPGARDGALRVGAAVRPRLRATSSRATPRPRVSGSATRCATRPATPGPGSRCRGRCAARRNADEADEQWRAAVALDPSLESQRQPDAQRRLERVLPSEARAPARRRATRPTPAASSSRAESRCYHARDEPRRALAAAARWCRRRASPTASGPRPRPGSAGTTPTQIVETVARLERRLKAGKPASREPIVVSERQVNSYVTLEPGAEDPARDLGPELPLRARPARRDRHARPRRRALQAADERRRAACSRS